ncbi:adenosylcobalamin-dependent ribonucleoside-diphosphate reductase [Candidatus Microgenomates bacterium]|nr:adenosylcobalamin-dependent ribonucleoside-diphosphate reductase [Candidatus Microgenomates bacterium]
MKLSGLAQEVFLDRYSLKDKKGRSVEQTPDKMWRRVARGIAQVEKNDKLKKEWAKKFYAALEDFKFVPGGRILTGAGTGYQVTYFNCFVLPSPQDSRMGIIKLLEIMTELMAHGAGVGLNLSSLRPRGSYIRTVNGTSTGPISWAGLYSVATGEIIQQGGSRRGALMLMLNDDHPDIEEFITAKKTPGKLQYANLSVGISDRFMEAVEKDKKWDLVWGGKTYKTLKARELWNLICQSAWSSAEPGVVFLDRADKVSNTHYFEKIVGVNVCGEQPLPAWGTCNLGAINLSAMVKNGKIDFKELAILTSTAVRFLDNVIDAEHYLYPEMEENQKKARRVGLGTMGLADALIKLKVRYGSKEALALIEKIYQIIRDSAYEASVELAKEKGTFPAFNKEKHMKGKFIKALPVPLQKKIAQNGMRNSVLLTQAPTGKTSLIAGVSSGIEPVFSFSYKQKDRLGEHLIYHPLFEGWQKDHPKEEKPDYFVTAMDLTPEEHVKTQALIQKYTDASISKTVNAPNEHSLEEVKKLYNMAYELGCKGITYMREGSREAALERINEGKKEKGKLVEVRPRPEKVVGATYRLETPVGTAFVTVNQNHQGEPLEVFVNVGKAGSDIAAMAEGLGRLVSMVLRVASPLPVIDRASQVTDQLHGIGGSKSLGFGQKRIRSLPDAIAKAISIHFGIKMKNGNGNGVEKIGEVVEENGDGFDLCPKCGQASLVYEEGCRKCHLCGFTEC